MIRTMTQPAAQQPVELSHAELSALILSGSSGSEAGKITFKPFSITRNVDKASPVLFL